MQLLLVISSTLGAVYLGLVFEADAKHSVPAKGVWKDEGATAVGKGLVQRYVYVHQVALCTFEMLGPQEYFPHIEGGRGELLAVQSAAMLCTSSVAQFEGTRGGR